MGLGEITPHPHTKTKHEKVIFPKDVRIIDVEVNDYVSCAIDQNNEVWCWGYNNGGKLGTGFQGSSQSIPMKVKGLRNTSVVSVFVGTNHQCVISVNSTIHCWGGNSYGQLGLGYISSWEIHPKLVQLPNNLQPLKLDVNYRTSCTLTTEGSVYCWGENSGKLGNGKTTDSSIPTQTLLPFSDKIAHLKVGVDHSCVLSIIGEFYCWGFNNYGQLGTKSTWSNAGDTLVPIRIDVIGDILDFDVGRTHTCILLTTQSITCWGYYAQGQLGWGGTGDVSGAHKNVNLNANSNQYYDAISLHLGGYSFVQFLIQVKWAVGGLTDTANLVTTQKQIEFHLIIIQ